MMDLVQFGQGTAIIKLQTTVSVAGEDIFVDTNQVPTGKIRVIQAVSMTPDSNLSAGENLSAFVCDTTMSPNVSPLLPSGRLDFSKTGVTLAGAFSVGTANPFGIETSPVAFVAVLGPGQFVRFSTSTLIGPFPNVGDFANIQVLYSDLPICGPDGMMNKNSLIRMGQGASIAKLQTSISQLIAGVGSDLWVDMAPVPSGYVRLIQAIAQTRDSTFTGAEEVSCFACDSTMNPQLSPVNPNTGRVNFAQLGVFIGPLFPFGTNPLSISTTPIAFCAVLAAQQFLRFITASLTPAQFPNPGDFANIQVFYSDIPIC